MGRMYNKRGEELERKIAHAEVELEAKKPKGE
jgi:hypothetical protein